MQSGKWRLSYIGSALIVSSGLLYTKQTKPKGLTLDNILEMIKEHPQSSYYEKKLKRRVTLGDTINNDKLGKKGKAVTGFRLKIKEEHDRDFAKLPTSGEELLSSTYRSRALIARK